MEKSVNISLAEYNMLVERSEKQKVGTIEISVCVYEDMFSNRNKKKIHHLVINTSGEPKIEQHEIFKIVENCVRVSTSVIEKENARYISFLENTIRILKNKWYYKIFG